MGTRAAEELTSLGEYLAGGLPPRLTEPGEFFTYSNQGMTLAAPSSG